MAFHTPATVTRNPPNLTFVPSCLPASPTAAASTPRATASPRASAAKQTCLFSTSPSSPSSSVLSRGTFVNSRPHPHPHTQHYNRNRNRRRNFPVPVVSSSHGAHEAPDYAGGFDPSVDDNYAEVRAFSFGPSRNGCALLTLYPVSGGPHAFKMSVTSSQADAIRRALSNTAAKNVNVNPTTRNCQNRTQNNTNPAAGQKKPTGNNPNSNHSHNHSHNVYMERPTTHDLTKNIVDACGGVVAQAAITHMVGDVFIARVWIRPPSTSSSTSPSTPTPSTTVASGEDEHIDTESDADESDAVHEQLLHVDARPSDALALAARASAPLFLHRGLLAAWGVSAEGVRADAAQGRCELVEYATARKSARSLRDEARGSPEVFGLAVLKARLDLAVRLQRFGEAAHLRDHITKICPVDFLALELRKAVAEQRFADAARLQDELTLWRARLRQWEKGTVDLDDPDAEGEETPGQEERGHWYRGLGGGDEIGF